MKTSFLLFFTISLFIFYGCKKEDAGPKTSGTFTLSSKLSSSESAFYSNAYSFSRGEKVKFGGEFKNSFDILLTNQYDNNRVNVIGARMNAHPSKEEAFALVDSFDSMEQASTAFESYKEAEDLQYVELSAVLEINDIWGIKTYDEKYAKVLVEEITINKDDPENQYTEVKFRFIYQPDGSKTFP
ncbi:MAG: hypothetical protein ACOCYF_02310 [Bacteroidota bacterium]